MSKSNTPPIIDGIELDLVLLHYALREKKFTLELSKEIKAEYFTDLRLQNFYSILMKNFSDPRVKDVLSVAAMLDYCQREGLEEIAKQCRGIYKKATEKVVGGVPPADTDFKYYLKQFKDRYNLVVLRDANKKIDATLSFAGTNPEPVNQLVKDTLTLINSINRLQVFDQGSVGQDAANMLREYQLLKENPEPFRGITVGIPSWDNLSNGLHPGELTIICGQEGSGKSILLMNWAIQAWLGTNSPDSTRIVNNGHNVLYFTLEMPRSNKGEPTQSAYLDKRILANVGELKLKELQDGRLSPQDELKLVKTTTFLANYEKETGKQLYIVDIPRGATLADIESKYLEVQEEIGEIDLVVVDYMGLMTVANPESDWQDQGNIAGGLHEFARVYMIPVVTAAQLNRQAGTNNKLDNQNYNNTRLGRSALIGQNCDNTLMIISKDIESDTEMEIAITKMRNGKKQRLKWTKAFNMMRIYDGAPVLDDAAAVSQFENLG